MIDLREYGFSPARMPEGAQGLPARVTAVHKERYELICAHGEAFGRLKTAVYFGDTAEAFPTVGDFVLIQYNDRGDSQILKTLERKSFFSRRDPTPGRGEQAVAANFDYVCIMASLNNDFNVNRIERYVVAAWQSGGIPVVILTKADLLEDYSEALRAAQKAAAGVQVIAVSARTGYGLELLDEYLKPGKTIVFLGSSGVGKSSLVNALAGEEIMGVREIREDDSRGRHTTTHRQLIMLDSGVMIIDTPGMRELGMWKVEEGLGETYSDVESLFARCKFSNCTHNSEPGCAVRAALADGSLTAPRWENYLALRRESLYAQDKEAYLRERTAFFKKVNKELRERYKHEGKK